MKPSETLPVRLTLTRSREDTVRGIQKYRETHETTPEEVTVPKNDLAYARFGVTRTFNLGNYESLRFEVAIEYPVHKDEIEAGLDHAKDLVHRKFLEYVDEAELPTDEES